MNNENPCSLFGITFKHGGHRVWFVICLIAVAYGIFLGITEKSGVFLSTLGYSFGSLSVISFLGTGFGRKDNYFFSRVCTPWNLSVALVCYGLGKLFGS